MRYVFLEVRVSKCSVVYTTNKNLIQKGCKMKFCSCFILVLVSLLGEYLHLIIFLEKVIIIIIKRGKKETHFFFSFLFFFFFFFYSRGYCQLSIANLDLFSKTLPRSILSYIWVTSNSLIKKIISIKFVFF